MNAGGRAGTWAPSQESFRVCPDLSAWVAWATVDTPLLGEGKNQPPLHLLVGVLFPKSPPRIPPMLRARGTILFLNQGGPESVTCAFATPAPHRPAQTPPPFPGVCPLQYHPTPHPIPASKESARSLFSPPRCAHPELEGSTGKVSEDRLHCSWCFQPKYFK